MPMGPPPAYFMPMGPPPAHFLSQRAHPLPLAPALEQGEDAGHGADDGDGAHDLRAGRGVPVSEAMRNKWMRCVAAALMTSR
jgi:hypothetical protein